MPLEQVSEVRLRLVTSRNGNIYRRRYADYKCSYCEDISEKRVSHANQESCGCQQRRLQSASHIKHGMHESPEYYTWEAMKQRCDNSKHKAYGRYGGRGIKVCPRWQTFENFFEDMGQRPSPQHSLDRIDNNGDYCPENCRWADRKTQSRNKRNNRILTINGISRNIVEWSEQPEAAKYETICSRIRVGWSDRDAVYGKTQKTETQNVSRS